jgi:hypothetical protein
MQATITHAGGVQTKIALEDGNLITGTVQDCTPIAEITKALHNEGIHGDKEFRHAASIPFVIIETYCNNHGLTLADFWQNPAHIKTMLNDPDLKAFRIWPGRV